MLNHRSMRGILSVFLSLSLLLPPLPCRALTRARQGLLDAEELSALLSPYLEEWGATEENFSLAFTYTGTGESYWINGERSFYGASLYKLPLCMFFAEKVSRGETSYDALVQQLPLEQLVMRSLVYSDNGTAGTLYLASGAARQPYLLASYSGMEPEELPENFSDFYFTSRFVLATLQTLYDEPERFPGIVEYMKQAQPEHYFRSTLEGSWEVAQKYGQYEGVLHTAGIIFTPTPILLVVMCDYMPGQLEAIGELAQLLADYSLKLDQRRAERAAEEASRTPAPTATPRPTPLPTPAAAAEAEEGRGSCLPPLLSLGVPLILGAAAAARKRRRGGADRP